MLTRGFTLKDQILREARDSYLAKDMEESQAVVRVVNPFVEYQGRPVEFIREILNREFDEQIEDMLNSAQVNPNTLAKSANGVGKTIAAACFSVYWFTVYDDAQVYTFAAPPEDNLKLLLWGEIATIVEERPELFINCTVSIAGTHIKRKHRTKSFITGLAIPQSIDPAKIKARFSGKHAPHILFVADEGDAIPKEIYDAVETCMSGGMARLLILFNPRAEGGPAYQMEAKELGVVLELSAFNHKNVVTGLDLIPGAVTREVTVRRINQWTVPVPDGKANPRECFQVPDFLVGAVALDFKRRPYPPLPPGWRKIIEPDFAYIVLARYPTQSVNQLINRSWIDAANVRWRLWVAKYGERVPGVRPTSSIDVAELGKDLNVFTLKYGGWVAPQVKWGGVDIHETCDRCRELYLDHDAQWCNVDATGVGAGVWSGMRRFQLAAHRIMVGSNDDLKELAKRDPEQYAILAGFDYIRSQMLWGLREWLRTDEGAMLPPDDELTEELLAPTYHKNLKQQIVVCSTDVIKDKLSGRSPDSLMSLGLQFAIQPLHDDAAELNIGNYVFVENDGRQRVGLGM